MRATLWYLRVTTSHARHAIRRNQPMDCKTVSTIKRPTVKPSSILPPAVGCDRKAFPCKETGRQPDSGVELGGGEMGEGMEALQL